MKIWIKILVKGALVILFMLCLLDMSYFYYQAVRFSGMAGFAWLAYIDSDKKNKSLMIVWLLSALLSNPFIKVSLGRSIWNIVDIIWMIVLLITIVIDITSMKKKVPSKN